jgi:tetratricopeptide (TPR) repeat protein
MKQTKLFLSLAFLVMLCFQSNAQSTIDKANAMYDKLSYKAVIPSFLALAKNNKSPEAIIKLANCYRMINDMKNAEEWYKEAVKLNDSEPVNKLYTVVDGE